MWKTTTLHVHHTFLYVFLCHHWTTLMWNDQILSWLENGKGKTTNSTISLWTQMRSSLFSSNLTSQLSSNCVTWHKGKKVSKVTKSIFQWHFHWHHRCWIVTPLSMSQILTAKIFSLNPLSPNSVQQQFSPNNTHTLSWDEVMRIN